jgi:hypothetical protein
MNGKSAMVDGSRIAVTLPARDFISDWRRYNLVANYIAEYVSYFFEHRDRAENVISSVFYELLEHMTTLSGEDARLATRLLTQSDRVVFEISTSSPRAEALESHRALMKALGSTDIDSFYRALLESPSDGPRPQGELSLAMLAHDYRATLSTIEGPSGSVTLHVSLGLEELRP